MAKKKKGRPSFKRTKALATRVELLVLAGKSHDLIARVIGCSTPTLEKYFPAELEIGAAKKLAEHLVSMEKSAKKGNASAQRYLVGLGLTIVNGGGQQNPVPAPRDKRGKKDIEKAAAACAGGEGTEWGSDLSPNVVAFKKPTKSI